MIVSFAVSNFRSFSTEQTLSLVAHKKHAASHEDHSLNIPYSEEKVLRAAVIYGANGAGKSNLFKALDYFKEVAINSRDRDEKTGRKRFLFAGDSSQTTDFDLLFIANNTLYRFGIRLNDEQIVEEWLLQVEGNKEKVIYERTTTSNGKVNVEIPSSKNDKLKALATVGGPPNQSFLASICINLDREDYGSDIDAVYNWFDQTLILVSPHASIRTLATLLIHNEKLLGFADNFLRSTSTGIEHLTAEKEKISEEALRRLVPNAVVDQILSDLEDEVPIIVPLGNGNTIQLEREKDNKFFLISIKSAHAHESGDKVYLDLQEESDGSQRLLNLIPALYRLKHQGAVFVIDEIDRSMHPMLVRYFLEFFLKDCNLEQGQLVVTTHESNLLDLELLRRDEIWFTEKDNSGSTHLYPLTDFQVRKDLEIRKHYLQGRFGAIPFLGNMDHLLDNRK